MMGEAKSDRANSWVITLSALLILASWSCSPLRAEETVGQQFRRILAQIDKECREYKSGPYLDQTDPEYRKRVADTSCDILKLTPLDWRKAKLIKLGSQPYPVPEDWLATPEGRFAHSIHLPPPYDAASPINREHMTDETYFEALCRIHSGEFVFRTIKNVRGIRQDRPWVPSPGAYSGIVFWTLEKGGVYDGQDYLVQPPLGHYQFLEIRLSEKDSQKLGGVFRLYYRDANMAVKRDFYARDPNGGFITIPYLVANAVTPTGQAEFGFTWRGIWPTGGLERGIEGFELIAYQIEPFEVIGFQRRFLRHSPGKGQQDWMTTHDVACSQDAHMRRPHEFIQFVLAPSP